VNKQIKLMYYYFYNISLMKTQ